jgi:hypothetical protein
MSEQTKAKEFVNDTMHAEAIRAAVEQASPLSKVVYLAKHRQLAAQVKIDVRDFDKLVREHQKENKKANGSAAPPADMGALRSSARHIIEGTDVLGQFAKEFDKVVAGEAANGQLLYLVATSRLLEKTMHAAIKGESAGGKSEIRKRLLDFFPPEDIVNFTSLSDKALIYYDGDFCHKILSMGEASATDEQKFQDYLLRELMSEGCLRYPVPQKVGNEIRTIIIEKHGPVTFLVTTTKSKLHPENESRLLSLEIDDTRDQTKSVLIKVAQVEGLHSAAPIDYRPWQDFQRWLAVGERRAVVPFAGAMAALIEPEAIRLRRDFGQVLRAIKAHALIHREHRSRDDAGRVVADVEHDYDAVRGLMNSVVSQGSGVALSEAMIQTIAAVTAATAEIRDEKQGVRVKAIARLLRLDKSTARRRLAAACSEGHLINVEEREKAPGQYRVAGQGIKPEDILPTRAALLEYLSHPPESTPQRLTDEIAEAVQEDKCGVDECTGASPDASLNHLNDNEESAREALRRGFQGGSDENDLPTCDHCGAPADPESPVLPLALDGEQYLLHPACRTEWLGEVQPDLSIPPFLRRGRP